MTLKMLDLFSGIGGISLAAHWTGIETVAFCEIDTFAQKVLQKRFPGIPIIPDIREVTWERLQNEGINTIDIISGGFPCQPFSAAGRRKGTADDRYLWPEMLRVISELRPAWVVGENVTGIITMAEPIGKITVENRIINRFEDEDYYSAVLLQQERMLLNNIIEDLCKIGYEVQPFIIPACGVGAPHKRERIFIVGHTQHNGQPS